MFIFQASVVSLALSSQWNIKTGDILKTSRVLVKTNLYTLTEAYLTLIVGACLASAL